MGLNKITTDVLVGGAIRVAVRLRGFVFIPLITGLLGVGAFGAYTQLLAIVSTLSLVFGLGVYKSLVRYGHRVDDTADLYLSLLCVSLVPTALVTVGFILLAPWISSVTLQSGQYATAFQLGALLILTRTGVRHARNYFRVDSRIKLYSLIEGIRAYAMITAVAVALVGFGTGLEGLFAAMVAVDIVILIALHARIVQEIGVAVPTFRNLRQHLRYSLPATGSTFVSELTARADRVLVGVFLGDTAVGLYSITYQIASGVSIYIMPIYQTFFPEFSKLLDDGRDAACAEYLRSGARYFLMIAVPSVGGLYLVGPDVIALLTQSQATPSPLLIAVLATGTLVMGIEVIYGSMMDAAEQTGRRAVYRTAGAVTNIGLNIVAIPAFGVLGAGIATIAAFGLVTGLTLRRVNTIVPSARPVASAIRCTGATLAMVLIAPRLVPDHLLAVIVVSVLVYFTILFAVRELTIGEVRQALPA